jgi:molybdopterin converting factor small subunit
MSVVVRIPTQLRVFTGGEPSIQSSGDSVREVLTGLAGAHPGLGERVFDDEGTIRRFVNIYLDDEDIRFLDGLDTSVLGAVQISIIPAVAGG